MQFEGGRSAEEIRKFWQNCEHPSINKQEWSGPEVEQLKAIAAKHGHLQWQKIAKELGVRAGGASERLGGRAGLGSPRAAWRISPWEPSGSSLCHFGGCGPGGSSPFPLPRQSLQELLAPWPPSRL